MVAKTKSTTSSVPAGGYEGMVGKVILAQKSRSGVSVPVLMKGLHESYDSIPEDKLKVQVRLALKRMLAKDTVAKVKASYKLTDKGKKALAPGAPKKAVAEKKVAAAAAPKKSEKAVVKKSTKKSATTKKAAAKPVKKATSAAAKPKKAITKKSAAAPKKSTAKPKKVGAASKPKKTTKASK
mmetsp:Transcript_2458/g.4319  ORF Transcript_2458/g.4319 Transcript_2458/m.4319 type:complete len:182 (-) Transcript_2458:1501-2046(-)|eukprot:CAMPEP_0182450914 /NCGR_PEP_ID=MMETSP1172-20130603/43434_1 /TAXON_ID=708627 /ORGANISM="Timspurckia oligopyrenoides, Strain CCMP3278" /LENGTH=181 /DNA_ID=CAMNT_0024648639 /DNA_START=92 /DNA_END=637 /DNA_ORIENTATION=+